ncbi:hypothetical protein POREN0001_0953 [Porphyromonas endodontalis ATCC 35406]|uniref:Uncharacterized protein n=1 Tax=Porphyromonas endodontalis (strain ATCC 35406 / DSM 24491 / JCM 8526 / CCUG 16442 / BCRC 14492 / NCTC 13058 / HG 370) TaxID=553175 RepID=C3JA31_POREA|nr:hypothetical protein POREN0001_0953 [Porphyromonas endodontalis ATCC 35406]
MAELLHTYLHRDIKKASTYPKSRSLFADNERGNSREVLSLASDLLL